MKPEAPSTPGMFEAIFAASPDPCLIVDTAGRLVAGNPAVTRKLGLDDAADWPSVFGFFDADDDRLRGDLERAAGGAQWIPSTARLTCGDLSGLRVSLSLRGLHWTGAEEPLVMVRIKDTASDPFRNHTELIKRLNRELTLQFELKERLEASLQKERYLHRELIHRVKNNLAVLSSLVRIRASELQGDEAREALNMVGLRIRSIALVHDLLDRNQTLDYVDVSDLVLELCDLMSKSLLPPHVTLNCEVSSLKLHNEDATVLCLLINELVTNSLKHAFTDARRGQIDLKFKQNGVDKMELRVRDDGCGMARAPADKDRGIGHGTDLLHALAQQLRGELRHETAQGTEWTLIFDPRETGKMAAE